MVILEEALNVLIELAPLDVEPRKNFPSLPKRQTEDATSTTKVIMTICFAKISRTEVQHAPIVCDKTNARLTELPSVSLKLSTPGLLCGPVMLPQCVDRTMRINIPVVCRFEVASLNPTRHHRSSLTIKLSGKGKLASLLRMQKE
jgi:hypothetical protein